MAYPAVRTPFIRFTAIRDMSLGAPELGGSPACSGKPFAQMNEPDSTGRREANWSALCDEPFRTALHKRTLIESRLQSILNFLLAPYSQMFSAGFESDFNDREEARSRIVPNGVAQVRQRSRKLDICSARRRICIWQRMGNGAPHFLRCGERVSCECAIWNKPTCDIVGRQN
jgi:hypothetical protein